VNSENLRCRIISFLFNEFEMEDHEFEDKPGKEQPSMPIDLGMAQDVNENCA
jgi:hypothetical protein